MDNAHKEKHYMIMVFELGESKRGIFLALVLTLIIHIVALLILPKHLLFLYLSDYTNITPIEEYEINLIDVSEPRFVEASPVAPKNKPDQTNNYSYREQQSADQSPLHDTNNQPTVEGEEDSQKILKGRLQSDINNITGLYTLEEQYRENQSNDTVKEQQTSQIAVLSPVIPEFIKKDTITEKGSGIHINTDQDNDRILKEVDPNTPINIYRREGAINGSKSSDRIIDNQSNLMLKPRLRPRLSAELITGPLMRSKGSASRYGSLAIDATFSEFGEYENQFYAAIQSGWYQEIEYFQPIDTATRVQVSFTVHLDGSITDLLTTHSTASDIATFICEEAISKRSPFRAWTKEMVEVFGMKRDLNIVFHYR